MRNLLLFVIILISGYVNSQCYIGNYNETKSNNLFWEIQNYEFVDFTGRVENKSTVILGWSLYGVDSIELLRSIDGSEWKLIDSTSEDYKCIIDQLRIVGSVRYVLKMHIKNDVTFSQTLVFKVHADSKKPIVVYDNLSINIYYTGDKNIKMFLPSGVKVCESIVKVYAAELDISELPTNNLYILSVNDNIYKIYK